MNDAAPYTDPNYGGDISYGPTADAPNKYPRLHSLIGYLRYYAYASFVGAVLGFIFLVLVGGGYGALGGIVFSLGLVAQGFAALLFAEIPELFMDIERNTRESNELLRGISRNDKPAFHNPGGTPARNVSTRLSRSMPEPGGA